MNGETYDTLALEENARTLFGISLDVKQAIVRDIPVSHTTRATVFMTDKKELMVYVYGKSRLTLADIKKIITRMGLVAELFLPPKGQVDYFDQIAKEKFLAVYPGRIALNDEDLAYYRTLAPYQPALVRIQSVKQGEIYQFDTDSKSGWRVAAKFAYRRLITM